ncbi:hypothetical protein FNV43_RR26983 [Rhamnella rubrinervis]|uniref:Strictosidine synthase conserved region domain-containing protein n=1 Tax=Rhamnella rubrinervis TaxID=2594499 RepID=A0A8K0DQE0_9ROSA|nr:hypothetical protein FNV43_RR26983 [Rhamnella rubrinervis]
MKYDSITKIVTVLMRGLAFANGVALSKDYSFVIIGESGTNQIHRSWLRGPRAQTSELLVHLQRSPDNGNRDPTVGRLDGRVVDPLLGKGPLVDERGRIVKVLNKNGLCCCHQSLDCEILVISYF